jgi:hypothetical protein
MDSPWRDEGAGQYFGAPKVNPTVRKWTFNAADNRATWKRVESKTFNREDINRQSADFGADLGVNWLPNPPPPIPRRRRMFTMTLVSR